jgi:aryl-alcohol dehydrogenase-like predicted oxidoreductase
MELMIGIHSSVLGFGCAPVLGSVGAKKAKRAIDCALDNGINHFDLARSYGYGEAEKFVGNLLKSHRRDKLVIASRFGIQANWKASMLRPAKPLVRYMKSFRKLAQPAFAQNNNGTTTADRFHDRIVLNAESMRKSLEKSLRETQTDYLDYFFVHEPHQQIERIDELSELALRLKEEGKIRAWGLAFMRSQKMLHLAYLNRFDILQFDNSPGAQAYDEVASERGSLPNILFSPFTGGARELKPKEKLDKLQTDFPRSVILCSMYNEDHLRQNVSSINGFSRLHS